MILSLTVAPAPKSEVDPAARHVIKLGKLRRDGQRVVLVKHGDAGAEHDPAGLGARARDHLQRAGDRGIMRGEMRAHPYLVVTVLLGLADDIEIPADDIADRASRVAPRRQKHPQLERHRAILIS